jgi:uncharacterized protein (TIGR03437 family)
MVVAIAPYSLAGKASTSITVAFRGAMSNSMLANLQATDPGLLTLDGSGQGQANIRNEDGSLNTPDNPAAIGSTVTLFFTGAGQTNPPGIEGSIAGDSGSTPAGKFFVTMDGQFANAVSIGTVPGFLQGLIQVTVSVPDKVRPGDARSISITGPGPYAGSQTALISIR